MTVVKKTILWRLVANFLFLLFSRRVRKLYTGTCTYWKYILLNQIAGQFRQSQGSNIYPWTIRPSPVNSPHSVCFHQSHSSLVSCWRIRFPFVFHTRPLQPMTKSLSRSHYIAMPLIRLPNAFFTCSQRSQTLEHTYSTVTSIQRLFLHASFIRRHFAFNTIYSNI